MPPLKGKLTVEQTNAIINARTELYALPDSARVDDVKEFRNTKVIDFTQLDVSDQVNNESIVVLFNDNNNESVVNKGPRPQSSSNGGGPDDMSEETVIPSMNKDPPITLEEALTLVQGDPDKYTNRVLYVIANLLSMSGFMVFLSLPFIFEEPKISCYNSLVDKSFRCSAEQACSLY